jgi:hypothetical protein
MRWLISCPVWGDRHVGAFAACGLPAMMRAIRALGPGESVKAIFHSDRDDASWRSLVGDIDLAVLPIIPGAWYESLSGGHKAVLEMAQPGEIVVLLTADTVISDNALAACRARFQQGKKAVFVDVPRAVLDRYLERAATPEPSSRALAAWGWANRHDMTRDMEWPDGLADPLARVYFERGGNVVARIWLASPLAVLCDGRALPFSPTADSDLIANFRWEEIHLVTDPDELAWIELSPFVQTAPSRAERQAAGAPPPMHLRYPSSSIAHGIYLDVLRQRICVVGDNVDCGDAEAVRPLVGA